MSRPSGISRSKAKLLQRAELSGLAAAGRGRHSRALLPLPRVPVAHMGDGNRVGFPLQLAGLHGPALRWGQARVQLAAKKTESLIR